MRSQTLGKKSQNNWKHCFNTDTLTIKKGAPVVLSLSTRGGYGVKTVSNLAAAEQGLFFGVATMDAATNVEFDSIFGYYEYARVVYQSRSDTNAVWASSTGFALGDVLAILTASDTTLGGAAQAFSRSAAGSAFTNRHAVIAAETKASSTTQASTLTTAQAAGGLYSTGYLKVFIAYM